jgi:dolichol-phosphate mannosyltransferase
VPVYNEEQVIPELLRRTLSVLDALPGGPHEVVLVDDGSTDNTFALLEAACEKDPRITAISLSRNFGHQAALGAALDHVSGDVVVTMDGDLQDPPEMIPEFLEGYHQGYDVVYAVRANRTEGLLLRLCYRMFYQVISSVAELKLPLDSGDFSLMSRRVVDYVRQSKERRRYLRGLRTWVGFQQKGLPVERPARQAGSSKYTARKLFGLAFDGIFSFSTLPLRAATVTGMVGVLASFVYLGYAAYARFWRNESPQGFTALVALITFLAGIQLFFLGVIGEYVGRIYEETKMRPHYVIKKRVGRE